MSQKFDHVAIVERQKDYYQVHRMVKVEDSISVGELENLRKEAEAMKHKPNDPIYVAMIKNRKIMCFWN